MAYGVFRAPFRAPPVAQPWIPTFPPSQTGNAGVAIVTVTALNAGANVAAPAGIAIVTVTALSATGANQGSQTGTAGVAIVEVLVLRAAGTLSAACYRVDSCDPADFGYTVGSASSATVPADCKLVNSCPPSDYGYSSN